jgi:hypothetical protein
MYFVYIAMNNHQKRCRFTAPKLSRVHSCTCVHRPLVEAGILSMPTLASRATAVSRRKRNQRASAHRLDRPVYTEKQRRGRNARTGAVTPSPAGGPPSLYLMPGLAVVGCCRQMSCTAASPDGTTHSTVVLQVDFA